MIPKADYVLNKERRIIFRERVNINKLVLYYTKMGMSPRDADLNIPNVNPNPNPNTNPRTNPNPNFTNWELAKPRTHKLLLLPPN